MKHPADGIAARIGVLENTRGNTRSTMLAIAMVASFALATVAAAHMRIYLPFSPVPITLQTLVVLLAGMTLGATRGGLSQAGYIALGIAGAPAFAGGLSALAGSTGGYLVGFVLAAVAVGLIYEKHRTTSGAIIACIAGIGIIYTMGCIWLSVLTGGTVAQVLAIGVVPFMPGMLLKVAAAVAVVRAPFTRSIVTRFFSN